MCQCNISKWVPDSGYRCSCLNRCAPKPNPVIKYVHSCCRKSKAGGGSPINSSGISQVGMPTHWDVSQTKASAANFSIGSNSAVQRSGVSMTSVGTHLGSSTGQGLVSATYSPLSHQGSLLRKDVDNQKNLRQADLNSVKRTPLSLKVWPDF